MIELLAPFSYQYMLNAIWVGALIGGVCGCLSAFIILKGWSLIADALSHATVPGVAVAYMLGLPFSLGAFFAGGLAALAMLWVSSISKVKEDVAIGIIFTSFFAAGLFLVSLSPASVDVQQIMLGNILAISESYSLQMVIIGLVCSTLLLLRWRDLLLVFFDEPQARAVGLPVTVLKVMFFACLSAATLAALQTVGALLVIAVVVIPGATAFLLTQRFSRLLLISITLGVVSSALGAYLSYFIDGATGGVIVCLQAVAFMLAFAWRSKQRSQSRRKALQQRSEVLNVSY